MEFKRDARDGRFKLMESNPRFTRSNDLFQLCGIDFAQLVYRRALGLTVAQVPEYEYGVRLWPPTGDLLSFRELRRKGQLTTRGWIRSVLHCPHFQLFRWTDPGPGLNNLWRLVLPEGGKAVRAVTTCQPEQCTGSQRLSPSQDAARASGQ